MCQKKDKTKNSLHFEGLRRTSMDFEVSSSKVEYSTSLSARSNIMYRLLSILIFLLSLSTVSCGDYFLCNPTKPSSCGFGGQCASADSVQSLRGVGRFEAEQFICKCEAFQCTLLGLDPVCGEDNVTYVNDVCRRAKECTAQKRINPVCKGRCGKPNCEPIEETVRRCPPHKTMKCMNFGECLLADVTNVPYCKCLSGYEGDRCQKVLIDVQGVKTEDGRTNQENAAFKIAFLVAVGILGLIAILHAVYCFIRCRESSNDEIFAEDGKKGTRGGCVTAARNSIEEQYGQEGNSNCTATLEEQDD